jgi:hypothetical protein
LILTKEENLFSKSIFEMTLLKSIQWEKKDLPRISLFKTADGSFTASLESQPEAMHNSAGAWGETQWVYSTAFECYLEQLHMQYKCKTLAEVWVVGTGLGTIEISLAAKFLSRNPSIPLVIRSFETHEGLRDSFSHWTRGLPSPLDFVFQDTLQRSAHHSNVKASAIRNLLQSILKEHPIQGEFSTHAPLQGEYPHAICVCYDAFSPATSAPLWEHQLLLSLLKILPRGSVFSTYASRSLLKKSAREQGWEIQKAPGFAGKRERTLFIKQT